MASVDVKTKAVGPYLLSKTLGRGQTGLVKLGVHCTSKKQVAVKIISKVLLPDNILQKVEREIAIMKLIEHPNVLRLYDVYENRTHLYLILEFVTGGELFDFLVKKGRLKECDARKFFRQLVSAMDFCHAHCVCHRDLKPENLLLDSAYNVKVCDFGMASLQVEHQLLETSCGSPHYACPEVIRGIKYDGRKADVWSCGIILYALVVGSLPFDDREGNLKVLLEKVKHGVFTMPEFLSPEVQDLIRRMVKINPVERLSFEHVMKHPWVTGGQDVMVSKIPVHHNVETAIIPSHRHLDRDVISSMRCLGSFKDTMRLVDKLLSQYHNVEKVMYFLLLKRKKDNPTIEDDDYGLDDDDDDEDRPRKRLDTTPAPQRRMSVYASPATFRRKDWNPPVDEETLRIRKISQHASPGQNRRRLRKMSLQVGNARPTRLLLPGAPSESLVTRPVQISESELQRRHDAIEYDPSLPGELVIDNPRVKRRLREKLEKKLESPKFHRKTYFGEWSDSDTSSQGLGEDPSVKKSWFSNILKHDKEEIMMIVKDKAFHTLKADIVRALLTLKVQHTVVSPNLFKLRYEKPKTGSARLFPKTVKFELEISSLPGDPQSRSQSVTMKLTKGSSRRFKRIVESIQERLLQPPTADELHQLPQLKPPKRRFEKRRIGVVSTTYLANGGLEAVKPSESSSFDGSVGRGSPDSSDTEECMEGLSRTPVRTRRATDINPPGH